MLQRIGFFNLYFRPFKKKWPLLIIALFFIAFVIYVGYLKGIVHPYMRDFYGFWRSGWDFSHGYSLYVKFSYAPQFYYPPFAAMVFVLLSLMPYGVASFVMYLLNVALLFVITELILRICNELGYKNEQLRWPLFLSVALSFGFYWATLDLFQVNAIVFVFCLLGIQSMLRYKNYTAAMMFILATFFKVIPGVFIIWLLVRRFSLKLLMFVIGFSLFLFLFPVPFRGFEQGIADIRDFFALMHHVSTHMINNNAYINQNLVASLMRLLTDTSEVNATNLHLFYLPFQTARIIVTIISSGVFIYFIWLMSRFIRFYKNPTLLEICILFLAAHLFSVFTWKAHLLTMALVYVPLFMRSFKDARYPEKIVLIVFYLLIVICAFSGRALIRHDMHILIASLNIFFYVYGGLFAYYAVLAERKLKNFVF
jgi:hypothetical protein